ncbi:MAG TPA: two-component regulator propeller domain-containing protein, partial [Acidobacteriota bacterium]|nr:two-component regulator propeller domain-containing protein [Acidobacteriota bacterium]
MPMHQAVTHSCLKVLVTDADLKGKLFLDWSHLPFFLLLVLWLLLSGLGSPVRALDPDRAVTQYVQTVWQDELPQTSVFSILQTRDGFLWVGTNEGIARFDGIEFRPFLQDHPIIKGRRINLLFEDSQGRLWVGASGAGLIMKDGNRWTSYTNQQGLPGNTPMALFEAADGILWVLTETGIGQFHNSTLTTVSLPAVITGTVMRTFLVEPSGTLWIGTDIGLFRLSNDEVQYLQLPPSPAGNQVQSLVR